MYPWRRAFAGTYFGDVIADSKGSSRSDVSVTLTATDGRSVRVSSDYPRIPSSMCHSPGPASRSSVRQGIPL
jgi:hypothetical protein